MDFALVLIAGLALGGLLVWLFMRSSGAAVTARLEDREATLKALQDKFDALDSHAGDLEQQLAREQTAREKEASAAEERLVASRKLGEELKEQFEALSRQALDKNSKSFLDLANTQIKQIVEAAEARESKQKVEMKRLVDPLKESLKGVTEHLDSLEKERVTAYTSLTEQVKSLSEAQVQIQKEAANLVTALRKPTVRGRWGEFHLKRVVELAGLVEHCDFVEQENVQTDGGRLRPDLIVHLAGGRNIVVDAKTPLDAYLNAIESEDPERREAFIKQHLRQVRDHVKQLSSKLYHDQFKLAPDMVILFLPGESILYEASHADPTLLEFAIENRVLIATPMTLIALLHGVATGWRQDSIAENAQEISHLGQELYERIVTYAEHFEKVGTRLNSAVSSYNKAVGSLESRVLVSARRFKEMGSASSQEITELNRVDNAVRDIQSADLKSLPDSNGSDSASSA